MVKKRDIVKMITWNSMLNEKDAISVMNRNKFVQIEFRSNDRTKWLTELIDRSL